MNEQKRRDRMRNWREDNAALVERGSRTVWFDEDHWEPWYAVDRNGQRGASRRYSDIAVQCGLVIREVFHLPLRATEGLIRSVIDLLGVDLATPDYSTFSRRTAALKMCLDRLFPPLKPVEHPVRFSLESTSLTQMGEAVLSAISRGELAPDQGAKLLQTLTGQARLIEVEELEQRITALEGEAHAQS